MENNIFIYRYSAAESREIEHIREKYLPQKENKIETLRALDKKVQKAGVIPSLCIGIIGCLIFGVGMCFGLDVLTGADWLSVLFCVCGAAVMIPAYPIYRRIARKTKAELTPEILRLSEEIISSAKK